MKIQLINNSRHPNPSYKTSGSAGMDICANIDGTVIIKPSQTKIIPTSLFIQLPAGFEAQIRPRSGLALNSGITVLNSPGTIDSDYRGEIKIILINHSALPVKINDGDRVAQMVISSVEMIKWSTETELQKTERGAGGFGSTGKK